ncbi:hypothetical protein [Propionivibrio sp.]|uniref:DUF7931 domain-containing protein n=1 Tax=Propionivibrio sp. TaxID=2212460 RepID=UPI002632C5C6|nr:hypothetical protein [Propionivibrio sp.]
MVSELITTWTEHDSALQKILLLASGRLRIFDEDLSRLKLEQRESAEHLQRFLTAHRQNSVCIVIKNTGPLLRESPLLMKLLAIYPLQMTVLECPPHLAAFDASLCIADDKHALIRFSKDHARSRIIIDSAQECSPYVHQFEEILKEGGEQVSATTLGL